MPTKGRQIIIGSGGVASAGAVAALTAAIIVILCLVSFRVSSSPALESRVMSSSVFDHPLFNKLFAIRSEANATFFDAMMKARHSFQNGVGVLNINAIDPLDPVHYRAQREDQSETDYDGDLGREHEDHMRDNGAGGRQSTVARTFVPIAAALPVIEAPSIAAEHPATEPVKTESE